MNKKFLNNVTDAICDADNIDEMREMITVGEMENLWENN